MRPPRINYGLAKFALPGQGESGDHYLISFNPHGVLIAVLDGVGHGEEAAKAAKAAISILKAHSRESIVQLVEHCHDGLRWTRGVALSLASIDTTRGMISWLGVGNIQGVLLRKPPGCDLPAREMLLLRGGVVGSVLPSLRSADIVATDGDTLVFATDGVRSDFVENLSAMESPQRMADKIMERYRNEKDDALVLVARMNANRG
ncbi:MAG TPA: SpoIIE family protein phosphatase [Candidatus Acidoferrum sp.]|nr:SpoIIE family protein phosphatase [Candidatus Acidoferrum sp.]